MAVLVAPVLHNNEPVKLPAVNVEVPQLFATVTLGAVGTVFGDVVPLPGKLTQPLAAVCVTE